MEITAIASVDLIQRRGSSLELKIPSIQIIFETTFSFFFGQRITVESCFHGTSSEPKKLSLLSVRTRNSVSLNHKKGEKIGITRFDLRVIES